MFSSRSSNIIYALSDPRTEEIRYVGQSTRGMIRPMAHLKEAKKNYCESKNTYKFRWIKGLLSDGLQYCVHVLYQSDSKNDLSQAEIYWIAEMRRRGHRLTNLTEGGDGVDFSNPLVKEKHRQSVIRRSQREDWKQNSQAARVKLSADPEHRRLARERNQKTCSTEQWLKKNREANEKWNASPESFDARSRAQRTRLKDPEYKKKLKEMAYRACTSEKHGEAVRKSLGRIVERVDPATGEIKEYPTLSSVKADGFCPAGVSCVTRGVYISHQGFWWRRADGTGNIKAPVEKTRIIERIDTKTGEIKEYYSFPEIKADGFPTGNVTSAIYGYRPTCKGHYWQIVKK